MFYTSSDVSSNLTFQLHSIMFPVYNKKHVLLFWYNELFRDFSWIQLQAYEIDI